MGEGYDFRINHIGHGRDGREKGVKGLLPVINNGYEVQMFLPMFFPSFPYIDSVDIIERRIDRIGNEVK